MTEATNLSTDEEWICGSGTYANEIYDLSQKVASRNNGSDCSF